MKTVNILIGLAVAAVAFTSCKGPKSPASSNAVYIADAAISTSKKIATDEFGGMTTLTARVADFMEENVYFDWKVNADFLDTYNAKYETSFALLPKEYYVLDKTFDTIKFGATSSKPLTIDILNMDALPASVKYAIPVSIANVKGLTGGSVLESSSNFLIIIDRVIITDVIGVDGYPFNYGFSEEHKLNNIKAWTGEYLIKPERLGSNNQPLLTMGPDEIYSRFGDVVIKPTQIQVKTQGSQPNTNMEFTQGKWYHVAYVYDGASLKIIVDGRVDINFPSPTIGFPYRIHAMNFGGSTRAQVAEVRLWTVARTEAQLIDAKYAVDPETPGLMIYWKCNEGQGTVIKDHTGNGYDAAVKTGNPRWVQDVRFPDTM